MTKHEKMMEKIKRHGENLNMIFKTDIEPVELCKKLLRLENKAHKISTDYCNGENGVNSENIEEFETKILIAVNKLLENSSLKVPIIFNTDARGYALKIEDEWMCSNKQELYSDWGGYGILAPDFNN